MSAIGVESEAVLVARAQAGDRAAFGLLAERYAGPLGAFACRRLSDRTEAVDVAQATLARALEAIDTLRVPQGFRGWLYGIALNECRHRRRGLGRLRAAYERWSIRRTDDARGREPPLEDDEARRVRAALEELPERQRLTVELRVLEGLSGEETAAALGCAVGTVKSNLHDGLGRLRERLSREEARRAL